MNYLTLTEGELRGELARLHHEYKSYCKKNLSLDLSRGKPGNKQLDLLTGMLDCISTAEDSHIRRPPSACRTTPRQHVCPQRSIQTPRG